MGMLVSLEVFCQTSTFPDFTNFDNESTCGTSCTGSCNPAGGWKNADQYGFPQAGTDWLIYNASTPSSSTGPDFDHTTGNTTTGRYIYVETSGCNNVSAELVSAIYDFSAAAAPRISFWWHMYGATMGQMHLDVDTTGLGNWVLDVVPSWTANLNAWQYSDFSIAQLGGRPSTRIRFRMITGSSFTSDAALDDITVYQPLPNDIGFASAQAGGGCGNSACTALIADLVNFGSDTVNAGTQIPVSFTVNSVTYTDTITLAANLLPGDTISYSFVNGCVDLSGPSYVTYTAWTSWSMDSNVSNDSASAQSIGIPVINAFPYNEDFETGQNGWTINNGTSGTWAFGTPAKSVINSAASGSNAFVTGGLSTGFYNDNDNSYIEGPCFDFSNICDPVIDLNVWWNAEFSWDGMNIVTSIDGGATWQLVGAYGDQTQWYTDNTVAGNPGGNQSAWSGRNSTSNGSNGWVNARHHLTGCGSQPNVKVRIYFGSDGSVTDDGCAFDDIRIYNGTYLGADQTICSPSTVALNADGGYPASVTYLWNTADTTSSITASSTGWYYVDVTNGSCVTRDSMYLVVIDANAAVSLGADTTLCSGTYALDAGYWPGSTYLWSDGSTTQNINASATGVYSVEVTTPCSVLRDTVQVSFNPASVNLGPDVTACDMAMVDAGIGNVAWLWSTGGTAQSEMITSSGTYYVDVTNASGCMASDTVVVTINNSPNVAISGSSMLCAGTSTMLMATGAESYQWVNGPAGDMLMVMPMADTTYWVVGTDTATGCSDSASHMITVAQPTSMSQSLTVCYGGNVMVGSNTYTTSGTYMDTLVNVAGCDSVITTQLTVDTLITSSQAFTICAGDSVPVGNNYYSVAGTYVDSMIAFNGCDSVVTTVINVNTVNVSTTLSANGVVISAVNSGASAYQWINCSTMQPIAGETNSTYTATANGQFAVIITDNGCSDTSACVTVTDVGVAEAVMVNDLKVFPNPTLNEVTITVAAPTQIIIYNALGEVVFALGVLNSVTLDIAAWEGGVYYIRTSEGNIIRLVKE